MRVYEHTETEANTEMLRSSFFQKFWAQRSEGNCGSSHMNTPYNL